MKILIVDDEELELERLAAALSGASNEIKAASDGAQALEIFDRSGGAELVITDYRMPRLNGLELLKAIKAIDKKTRVWLVSGQLQPSVMEVAYGLGAEKVLPKPKLEHELFLAGIIK